MNINVMLEGKAALNYFGTGKGIAPRSSPAGGGAKSDCFRVKGKKGERLMGYCEKKSLNSQKKDVKSSR